ncbi:MAG: T9SS type A sorting domain-containing protein [Crocinitomicaceae bacterium]|nr:T9SS type A sorting domain-containing protein [Crocinitomicaceae bacterium]
MKKLLSIFLITFSVTSVAQDSLKVMFHNLLNFPSAGVTRTVHYRKILQYAQPDVYLVNELESEYGADLILDSSLNIFGTTQYQRSLFINGPDTDNCLFYNTDKLGLLSQYQLTTVLRDISVYRLYYKAPNLSAITDTIYFWFFSCHLKAGVNDFEQRKTEALQIKYYLNDIVNQVENVFVGGDFNFYSGFESGCQALLNQGAVQLIDPANAVGNWSNDWNYSDWHTQSTRTSSFGSGSGGGMDDRFDLIFVSEDVMSNANGVTFIPGTFTPLGQDGNHYNDAINSGVNNAAPDSVIQALFWGSDHLPIMMDIALDETAGIPTQKVDYIQVYYSQDAHALNFTTSLERFDLVLYDMMGRIVFRKNNVEGNVVLPDHLQGVYIWSVISEGKQRSDRIVIH